VRLQNPENYPPGSSHGVCANRGQYPGPCSGGFVGLFDRDKTEKGLLEFDLIVEEDLKELKSLCTMELSIEGGILLSAGARPSSSDEKTHGCLSKIEDYGGYQKKLQTHEKNFNSKMLWHVW
jgi:hypothetical protein